MNCVKGSTGMKRQVPNCWWGIPDISIELKQASSSISRPLVLLLHFLSQVPPPAAPNLQGRGGKAWGLPDFTPGKGPQ